MPAEGERAPGWKADPKGKFAGRYWDGSAWTPRVSDGNAEVIDEIKNSALKKYPEPGTARYAVVERMALKRIASGTLSGPKVPDPAPVEMTPRQADIDRLATEKLTSRLGVGREVKALDALLGDGERPITMARGTVMNAEGIVVVTDERVIFLDKRLVAQHFEDFPLKAITAISTSTKMMFGYIRIFIGSHFTDVTMIAPKERAKEIVDTVRELQGRSPTPQVQQPGSSRLEQLERLASLRAAGVLTAEEFESEKQRVLD